MKLDKNKILTLISGMLGLGSIALSFISGKVDDVKHAEEEKELIEKIGKQIAKEIKKEL